MARTDEAAVRDAISTGLTSAQVVAFIDDASAWVDANLLDKGYSTAILTAIEKYLACHFVTFRDPRLKSATYGKTSENFQRDANVNDYLQAAIALDPSGAVEDGFLRKGRKRLRFRVGSGYDPTLGLGVTEA